MSKFHQCILRGDTDYSEILATIDEFGVAVVEPETSVSKLKKIYTSSGDIVVLPMDKELVLLIPQQICAELLNNGLELDIISVREGGNLVKIVPIWGVPITYLSKHNPKQFNIIATTDRGGDGLLEDIKLKCHRYDAPVVNGSGLYKRIFIKPIN